MNDFLFYLALWLLVGACMFLLKKNMLKDIRSKAETAMEKAMSSDEFKDVDELNDADTSKKVFNIVVSLVVTLKVFIAVSMLPASLPFVIIGKFFTAVYWACTFGRK